MPSMRRATRHNPAARRRSGCASTATPPASSDKPAAGLGQDIGAPPPDDHLIDDKERRAAAQNAAPFLFIIAGEPSGDNLGAALIRALRERTAGRLRLAGVGGEQMAAEGLASLVPLADLAVAGVAEVLPRAPLILRRVRETVAAIRTMRPDAVVTIDSSGFTWRIAHRLRRHGERLPLIHYVAPMVWAWRAGMTIC